MTLDNLPALLNAPRGCLKERLVNMLGYHHGGPAFFFFFFLVGQDLVSQRRVILRLYFFS